MLQAQNTQQKRTRALPGVVAIVLSALLAVGAVVGGTQAYLMSKTDTYANTFVSGLPAAGELKVEGKKILDGRTLVAGEFSFELYKTGSDFEVVGGADPVRTAVNEGNGAFAFAPLGFTQTGDFYYVVTEKAPARGEEGFLEHVTYDQTQYRIAVKVTEANGAYVVDSEIVAFDPEAAIAALDPQVDGAPARSDEAAGNGDGADADADGATNGGDAGEPAAGSDNGAVPADAEGDASDGNAPEGSPSLQSTEYSGTEVEAIVFKNMFDSPDPTVVVNGAVSLDGRDMKAEEFSFELYKTDADFAVKPDAEPVEAAKNASAGAESGFGFAALTFSDPSTYYYVIRQDASNPLGGVTYDDEVYRLEVEVKADDVTGMLSATAKMYVQDADGNWVEVTVLQSNEQGSFDNPDGKPYVAEDPQNNKCAVAYVPFANSYKAESVSHDFAGDVDLEGRDMAAEEFLFTIEPQDGAPAPGALSDGNDADGGFGFGSVEFDEPGEYHYLVKQDASGALEGVTYDGSVHRVIVTVTDDGNGKLVASVVVWRDGVEVADGSGIKYLNKYAKPGEGGDEPDGPGADPELPGTGGSDDGGRPGVPGQGGTDLEQTGDATMMLFGVCALVAVCAVTVGAVALVKMRRRS